MKMGSRNGRAAFALTLLTLTASVCDDNPPFVDECNKETPCPEGRICCADRADQIYYCVTLNTSSNCGGCGAECADNEFCMKGTCVPDSCDSDDGCDSHEFCCPPDHRYNPPIRTCVSPLHS